MEDACERLRGARIVVVCGVQGAGKTTWIVAQPKAAPVIYFDAALPGIRHRAKLLDIARSHGVGIDAVWIRTPLDTALQRNALRPADEIVPVAAILSVANQFEEPTTREGFDRVVIVDT
nr:kinase [Methylobacterium sp. OTU13CASTA1]